MSLYTSTLPSPVGTLTLVASDAGLVAILWEDDRPGRVLLELSERAPDHPILAEASRQLIDYFDGALSRFTVPLDLRGTDFRRASGRHC